MAAHVKDLHLAPEPSGRWYRMVDWKGRPQDGSRYLSDHLTDTTNCTHSLNRPGERCCYCGGTVNV